MRWLLGILAVLAVALVIQSGLLAYAMYVLLGVLLLTRLLTLHGLNRLTADRAVSADEIDAGERIEVEVRLHNDSSLPIPWVLMEDLLPEFALRQRPPRLKVQGKRLAIRLLRGGQSARVKYKLDYTRHGFY